MRTNLRQRPHPATTAKIQRWIDLVAGLLVRRTPATFDELAKEVPQYLDQLQAAGRETNPTRRRTKLASLKRTFERDKDELRHLGVLLQTLPDPDAGHDAATYRLRSTEFYLPYLCLACPIRGKTEPRRIDRYGYRALTTLAFTPDELQAVVDAAGVAGSLGDPMLQREASGALRKLAADLPVDTVQARSDEPRQLLPRARAGHEVFAALGDAVRRRKAVEFRYEAPAGHAAARRVDPWGLFFIGGHWYLAAHDLDRKARRNFRLNRIGDVRVNATKPGTPDFTIPDDFDLRDLARARRAWELGDGDEAHAIVEFRPSAGQLAPRDYGEPVEGWPMRRAMTVRRWEPLVRWIMSFAGGVVPVAPQHLVERYRAAVAATRVRYDREPAAHEPSPPTPISVSNHWMPDTASEQWRRILHLIPALADGTPQPIAHLAASTGSTVDTLQHDLHALVTRYDLPAGFVEGVQVFLDADHVSAVTNHFLRPLRLTVAELCALELGLAVLRHRRPPDEHHILEQARARLRACIARLPDEVHNARRDQIAVGDAFIPEHAHVLREAIRLRRMVRLRYQGPGRPDSSERRVQPRGLIASHGTLYLVAWCERARDLRTFRLDRIEQATLLDETFPEESVDLDRWITDGKVFHGEGTVTMRVWYSPVTAPWVAEREGRQRSPDGTLVVDHPVADREWALRHVLQYADGAELIAPPDLRVALLQRLESVADDVR